MSPTPYLRLAGIGKRYATPVLNDIDLTLNRGEVLALTGENGAGKSTLSKIVAGLITPTSGEMWLDDAPYRPASRRAAEALGIRMVMQELSLIPTLSVAENLYLGHLPQRGGFLRTNELNRMAGEHMAAIGLERIDPRQPVGELGIGHQQMVEIARSLIGNCRLLILDEPTAMLTPHEIERLFTQIARLKADQVSLVYISHRLGEIETIADRICVLRDGHHVETRAMADTPQDVIVRLMVGREVLASKVRPPLPPAAALLRVEGLTRAHAVRDISFDVRPGEIFGIAGLVGSGRTELLRLIFGADRAEHGAIYLRGSAEPTPIPSPLAAVRHGIGLITEDRKSQSLLLDKSIILNTTLATLEDVTRHGWLKPMRERELARQQADTLDIRCNTLDQAVGELSGGNQQKVVLARWLLRDCEILLLDEPTRGVDIGARADIYRQMEQMAAAGKALVVVSSDLRELMEICDRIGVMSAGRLVKTFPRGEWEQQTLLEAAFSGYNSPASAPDKGQS